MWKKKLLRSISECCCQCLAMKLIQSLLTYATESKATLPLAPSPAQYKTKWKQMPATNPWNYSFGLLYALRFSSVAIKKNETQTHTLLGNEWKIMFWSTTWCNKGKQRYSVLCDKMKEIATQELLVCYVLWLYLIYRINKYADAQAIYSFGIAFFLSLSSSDRVCVCAFFFIPCFIYWFVWLSFALFRQLFFSCIMIAVVFHFPPHPVLSRRALHITWTK